MYWCRCVHLYLVKTRSNKTRVFSLLLFVVLGLFVISRFLFLCCCYCLCCSQLLLYLLHTITRFFCRWRWLGELMSLLFIPFGLPFHSVVASSEIILRADLQYCRKWGKRGFFTLTSLDLLDLNFTLS